MHGTLNWHKAQPALNESSTKIGLQLAQCRLKRLCFDADQQGFLRYVTPFQEMKPRYLAAYLRFYGNAGECLNVAYRINLNRHIFLLGLNLLDRYRRFWFGLLFFDRTGCAGEGYNKTGHFY